MSARNHIKTSNLQYPEDIFFTLRETEENYWARKLAEFRGLNLSGKISILVEARKRGLIMELKTLLDKLVSSNFRISPELYKQALIIAGE